jgi:hypothetical protein
MSDYRLASTTDEVWSAIRAAHPEMVVFNSFSNPCGGIMETSFGFKDGDYPVIEAQTTWEIDSDRPHERINEAHKYWLCVSVKADL